MHISVHVFSRYHLDVQDHLPLWKSTAFCCRIEAFLKALNRIITSWSDVTFIILYYPSSLFLIITVDSTQIAATTTTTNLVLGDCWLPMFQHLYIQLVHTHTDTTWFSLLVIYMKIAILLPRHILRKANTGDENCGNHDSKLQIDIFYFHNCEFIKTSSNYCQYHHSTMVRRLSIV